MLALRDHLSIHAVQATEAPKHRARDALGRPAGTGASPMFTGVGTWDASFTPGPGEGNNAVRFVFFVTFCYKFRAAEAPNLRTPSSLVPSSLHTCDFPPIPNASL